MQCFFIKNSVVKQQVVFIWNFTSKFAQKQKNKTVITLSSYYLYIHRHLQQQSMCIRHTCLSYTVYFIEVRCTNINSGLIDITRISLAVIRFLIIGIKIALLHTLMYQTTQLKSGEPGNIQV